MKVKIGPFNNKNKRSTKIEIDVFDCYNVDNTIAIIVCPLLEMFKKKVCGHPGHITMNKWKKILDKMIWSMKQIAEEKSCYPRDEKRIQEGLNLFGEYFQHLWY